MQAAKNYYKLKRKLTFGSQLRVILAFFMSGFLFLGSSSWASSITILLLLFPKQLSKLMNTFGIRGNILEIDVSQNEQKNFRVYSIIFASKMATVLKYNRVTEKIGKR